MRGPLIYAVLFSALGVIAMGEKRGRALVALAVTSSALVVSAAAPKGSGRGLASWLLGHRKAEPDAIEEDSTTVGGR